MAERPLRHRSAAAVPRSVRCTSAHEQEQRPGGCDHGGHRL